MIEARSDGFPQHLTDWHFSWKQLRQPVFQSIQARQPDASGAFG
jgi:hypothetical protein